MNLIDIINEIKRDTSTNHLDNLRRFHQNKLCIPFNIKDKEYEFVIVETNYSTGVIASIVFKNMKSKKSVKKDDESIDSYTLRLQNDKFGITNTGDSVEVFGKVFNILLSYIEKFNPTFIQYFAEEPNRQSLYNKLIERVEKSLAIQLELQSTNPTNGEPLQQNEFLYKLIK